MPTSMVQMLARAMTGATTANSIAEAPRIPSLSLTNARDNKPILVVSCRMKEPLRYITFYSTSDAVEEPIGLVPDPLQLMAKFALPVNVIVFATSWVQALLVLAPPANSTAASGT